jgi:hypothetical protein
MTTQKTKSIFGRTLVLSGLCLALAGCGSSEQGITIPMQIDSGNVQRLDSNSRYEVKRAAVFKDNLAYSGKRGIYEIKDKQTGKIYVGVSGIGITEKGSHSTGKTTAEDEQ